MNSKNIENNDDLANYLVWLGARLGAGGQTTLADDAVLASRFANGSSSEFLHEAQHVLEKILNIRTLPLTDEEIREMCFVVTQIKDAFRKIGGA